jgi:dTDP-4-amino-4,6-dideoxygalactose transaminase
MLIEDFGYGFGGNVYGVPVGSYADVCIYSFHSSLLGDAGVIICKQNLVHQIIENLMKEDNSSNWMGLGSSPMMYAYLDAQMDKHEFYFSQRRMNWKRLHEGLAKYSKYFRFHKTLSGVNPSWTGFVMTIKLPSPFTKAEIMEFLDIKNIGTRSVIGNVFQAESYKDFNKDGDDELINSNYIHENSFIVGCNPDMRQEHIDWVIKSIGEFLETYERKEEIKD